MDVAKLPNEFSKDKDPNFKYPEKYVMPDDYNFDLTGINFPFTFSILLLNFQTQLNNFKSLII